jgi:hypothetical protein
MRDAFIALATAAFIAPWAIGDAEAATKKEKPRAAGASQGECVAAARASGKFNFQNRDTAGRAAVQRCRKLGVGAI